MSVQVLKFHLSEQRNSYQLWFCKTWIKTFWRTQSTVFLKEKLSLPYHMTNTVAPLQEHLEGGLRLSAPLEKSAIPERYSWHSPLCKQINIDFLVPHPVSQCHPRKTALGSFWNIGPKPFRLTQEAFEDENFLRTALISALSSFVEEHLGQLWFEIFSKKCQTQLNNVVKTTGNHWN